MKQEILKSIQDSSLLPKAEKELDIMSKTEDLNGRPIIEKFYDIWKNSNGKVGSSNKINSWTAYAVGITTKKPDDDSEFLPKRRAFARKGFPDIDTDFDYEHRDEVYEYIINKYGREQVGNIGTYGTLTLKSFIQRCGKVLDIADSFSTTVGANGKTKIDPEFKSLNNEKVLEINKSLNQHRRGAFLKVTVDGKDKIIKTVEDAYEYCPDFRYYMDKYPGLRLHSKNIEGLHSNFGVHAAGIVVSNVPLNDIAPLRRGKAKAGEYGYATQFSNEDLEQLGLIKFDILAISTISVLKRCSIMVKENYGISLDLKNLPLDDNETYKLYSSGKLIGVFQCEEPGMQKTMIKIGVNCFDDIMACLSLYRPGPMAYIPTYANRKKGREKIEYFHESIEPYVKDILSKTYGVLVYQEQVMQICNSLAGFSISDGYVVIKAIGKKKESLLKKYKNQFISGCVNNNVAKNIAEDYWDNFISPFASYGFNACLDGDTAIEDCRRKNIYTLEKLSAMFDTNKSHPKIYVNSYLDGDIVEDEVLDVFSTGEKEVFEIELENGSKIECTLNHKFMCVDGVFREIKDIFEVGYDIFCEVI